MKVLGIETSCDETAAAVAEDGKRLLSNVVASSADLHVQYGGVVPEIAARSHIEVVLPVIQQALEQADCTWDDIDAIAVTRGAGLGGSLLIGVLTARTLAIAHNKPLYGVNHVEGHLYVNFITETSGKGPLAELVLPTEQPQFPALGLIVSGGHSQLVLFQDHFDYVLLGQTQDDAIGEAFDKVAKLLGLPYPGGVSISRLAESGNKNAYILPKATMTNVPPALADLRIRRGTGEEFTQSYDFSFSGLKTAVLRLAQSLIGEDHTFPSTKLAERLSDMQKADIAASFQRTAIETVVDKAVLACNEFQPRSFIIGGGVASSSALRSTLAERLPLPAEYTDRRLCTDNGAMIAALGCFKHSLEQPADDPFTLDIKPNLSM